MKIKSKKDKYRHIYQKFKNDKKTEGYSLDGIYEVFLPFWYCKQKIVVEKDVELDRFSKILLELVHNGIDKHSEICGFLGIEEDDFVTMQFHYLIKNELLDEVIEDVNLTYQITHEGISFLKKKKKIANIETVDFEYFYNDLSMEMLDIVDYKYLYNDMSKEYFNPNSPIDKNRSKKRTKNFTGYKVLQTHKLNLNDKNVIPHKNKPLLSNIKQADFAQFFNKQMTDSSFYDYEDNKIEAHKRAILFLLLDYINEEEQHIIEIRQFRNSVRDYNGNVLEEKLTKAASKYLKNNNTFLNDLKHSVV